LKQRDEVFRAIIERVKKKKGDDQDPEKWTGIIDADLIFISHSTCVRDEVADREARIEIPGENYVSCLFDESSDEDDKPDLKIVE
jgi:hypothetical protein